MAKKRSQEGLLAGLDLGSTSVRMAVGQMLAHGDQKSLHILGAAEVPSEGIHKGSITSIEDAVSSVSACLEKVERSIGTPIDSVWVGVAGHEIITDGSKGVVAVARPNGEVTEEDVERVIEAARTVVTPLNFEILHVIPRYFRVDGSNPVRDPVSMSGVRLEVDALIVQASSAHIRNITKTVYRTSLNINDLVLSMLSASEVVTTERGRDMGVAVVDIGGTTTSLVVIEGGDVIHVGCIPIGSDHITADIAIGLRTSIEIAEQIKVQEGTANARGLTKKDEIDITDFGGNEHEKISRKYVAEIIEARVEELFDKINNDLKKIGRAGLLPAGVICIGGGAKLQGLLEVSKKHLRLPSTLGYPIGITGVTDRINDIAFSSVIGLVKWGADVVASHDVKWGGVLTTLKSQNRLFETAKKWLRSFFP